MEVRELVDEYNNLMQNVRCAIEELTNGELIEIEELQTENLDTIYSVDDEHVYYYKEHIIHTDIEELSFWDAITLIERIQKAKSFIS